MIHRQLVLTQVGVFELYCPRARVRVCVCVQRCHLINLECVCSLCSIPMRLVPVDLFSLVSFLSSSNHEVMLTCI